MAFRVRDNDVIREPMTIKHSGNVGIGTTSPQSALHVAGNVNSIDYTAVGVHMGVLNNLYPHIELVANNGKQGWIDFRSKDGNSDYEERIMGGLGRLEFHTNHAIRMKIDEAGNVGIGTTTPMHFCVAK